jgi:hypothetical protein
MMDYGIGAENKHSLIERLVRFIQETDLNEPLEFKPTTEFYSKGNQKKDEEKLHYDYAMEIDKQLTNIGENIAVKFFELSDEKFQAVMKRIKFWGYELCLEEFILNYYLVIKKDNRLRQFVILHLEKLVSTVKKIIENQLYDKMNDFSFTNSDTVELANLKDKLRENEQELIKVKPEKLADDTAEEIITTEKLNTAREQILADLRAANPELETDNWI